MKVKAKVGLIYNGTVYKAGEVFDVDDKANYAFTWLRKNQWLEIVGVPANSPEPDDGLLAGGKTFDGDSADLPPLDEPAPVKKGKKNA